MTTFIIGCVLFGLAGAVNHEMPWYRTALVVALASLGANLVNSSGIF